MFIINIQFYFCPYFYFFYIAFLSFSAWVGEGNNWCSPYKGWQIIYENSPLKIIKLHHLENKKNLILGEYFFYVKIKIAMFYLQYLIKFLLRFKNWLIKRDYKTYKEIVIV